MQKLLREPLLHFLLLGALLFGVYALLNPGALLNPDRIVVDRARVEALVNRYERTWQRPPSAAELKGLVDNWVRDEILYREGRSSDMDKDDEVIRRRVIQKMTYFSQDVAGDVPTEGELQAWLDGHGDRYRLAPTYSLQQVYLDPQRHGDALASVATNALTALRQGRDADPGDVSLLPRTLEAAPAWEVQRIFGEEFAQALRDLPEGQWQGPIRSGYGLHLVRIGKRVPARNPSLDEVRQSVVNDIMKARADQAVDTFYDSVRSRYAVVVDADVPTAVERQAAKGDRSEAGDQSAAGVAVQ